MGALPAHADDSAQRGDGVYGRLDGDVTLSAGLGAGAVFPARGDAALSTALELRARFLDAAGLFVVPEWRPDAASEVTLGLDLRPLFPARFLMNMETGLPWVDLLVDSIGVDVGVALLPIGEGRGKTGAAFAIGGGLDVPLVLPAADAPIPGGLFLRLAGRHTAASSSDLHAGDARGVRGFSLFAVLTWRAPVRTGLITRPTGPR